MRMNEAPPRIADRKARRAGGLNGSGGARDYLLALRLAFTRDPRFVICVSILSLGAISVQWLSAGGFRFSKERLDLKVPLEELNQKKIEPYRLVGSDRIQKEEVEALGTEEYIRWRLENTSVSRNDPLRHATLFVTYYSGQPDQVPHVPEECFLGGGYQQLGADEKTVHISQMGVDVPVRVLTFRKDSAIAADWSPTVVYLFSVNGRFVDSRDAVRLYLSNPFERFGYFSKVEVTFGRPGEGPKGSLVVLKAAESLLDKVLPVLVKDHWPDWPPREVSPGGKAATKGSAS
jgi:hypothetical protein